MNEMDSQNFIDNPPEKYLKELIYTISYDEYDSLLNVELQQSLLLIV